MTTVSGQIQSLRAAWDEYNSYISSNDTTSAYQTFANSYSTIEWCLAQFAQTQDVPVDAGVQDDGTHSYHENLISAFSDPPLSGAFPSLSSGPIQGILSDSKVARNVWTRSDGRSDDELNATMSSMANGYDLVINALDAARSRAGLP